MEMKKFIYYLKTEKLKDFIPYYWTEFLRFIGCYTTYTWKQTNNLKPGETGLDITCEKLSKIRFLFGIKIHTKYYTT